MQAGDLGQDLLQVEQDRQQSLKRALVLVGMLRAEARAGAASRSFRLGLYFIVHEPSG